MERSLNGSEQLLRFIGNARNVFLNVSTHFETALNVSQRLTSIVLPSDESIVQLARRIIGYIMPEGMEEEIMSNASRSRAIAEEALELAQSTR